MNSELRSNLQTDPPPAVAFGLPLNKRRTGRCETTSLSNSKSLALTRSIARDLARRERLKTSRAARCSGASESRSRSQAGGAGNTGRYQAEPGNETFCGDNCSCSSSAVVDRNNAIAT